MDSLNESGSSSDRTDDGEAVERFGESWESPFRTKPDDWAGIVRELGVESQGPGAERVVRRRGSPGKASTGMAARGTESADPTTAWGFALREVGRLGAYLGDEKFAVLCINDAEHSEPAGTAENATSSCVLLPALEDHPQGLPLCKHGHCENLTRNDWLAFVGEDVWGRALDAAKALEAIESDESPTADGPTTPPTPPPSAPAGVAVAPDSSPARSRIVVQRRLVTRDDNGGVSGAKVERTPVPDLSRDGLVALGCTPWGERAFVLENSNPPCMVHVLPPGVTDGDHPDHVSRARVVTTSRNVLRGWLSGSARWVSEGAGRTGRESHEADPPDAVVCYALESCEGMRPLRGVVEAPVMRADGSILDTPGYDPATHLFAAFDEVAAKAALAAVPARPTKAEAIAAFAVLRGLVRNFPFENEAHASTWIAGLLTMFARLVFTGPAPLFFIRANTRGSGKTLLAELPYIIATGERPAMLGWSGNEEEFEKLVTTEAIAGSQCIIIDNITGTFKSATLDRILTSGRHRARILGGNQKYDGPFLAVWWGTGNNVETSDDLASRRTAPIELVSEVERPEDRTGFDADKEGDDTGTAALRAKARRERWRYVAAAVTILRAWHFNDRPGRDLSAWGSFESWSRVVRGAIVFAGGADPGKAHEEFRDAASADVGQLRDLVTAWDKAVRVERLLSPGGESLARALKNLLRVPREKGKDAPGDDLRDALEAIAGGESIDRWRGEHSGRVGRFLRSNRRKVAGKLMLDTPGESGGVARWRVVPATAKVPAPPSEPGGMSGIGGIAPSPPGANQCQAPALEVTIPPNPPIPPGGDSGEDWGGFDFETGGDES